eukprot:272615_1
MVWSISISFMNIARLISIYYFYNYFQFYTTHNNTYNNKNDIEMKDKKMEHYSPKNSGFTIPQYNALTKTFSLRMKLVLIVAILCLLAIAISATAQTFTETSKPSGIKTYKIVYHWFGYFVFYEIPLYLAQFILSIYYCEGCIFVKSLIDIIDKSIKIDFD